MKIKISASLLSANFAALGEDVLALEKAGVDRYHFDIMDGHFVPNLTFGPAIMQALRPLSQLPFEAHMMVSPAYPYLEVFVQAGADILLIHPEAETDLRLSLQKIRQLGKKAGIVLNPSTSIEVLSQFLNDIDQVLIMTVNPGFAGQHFLADQFSKIKAARQLIGDRPIDLAVDGGINPQTGSQVVAAGANVLIAGTSIFYNRELKNNIRSLHNI